MTHEIRLDRGKKRIKPTQLIATQGPFSFLQNCATVLKCMRSPQILQDSTTSLEYSYPFLRVVFLGVAIWACPQPPSVANHTTTNIIIIVCSNNSQLSVKDISETTSKHPRNYYILCWRTTRSYSFR